MKKWPLFLTSIVLALIVSFACKKNNDSNGQASLEISLTDAPAGYDAVLIDVKSIEIHSDNGGWTSVPVLRPGIYNLLDFRNGMDTLLAKVTLPAGTISQMRLVLGDNNAVVVEGQEYPLKTPSAEQSGLKFNIHQTLEPNGSYKIWIDFDAGKSIVANKNGYILKPVIRTYTEATDGKIKGIVLPIESLPVVYAIKGTDTATAIPDANGFFMFSGMPEGSYHIWIDGSEAAGFQDATIDNVVVTFGKITDIGTTTLP